MAPSESLPRRPFLGLHVKAAPDGRMVVHAVLDGSAAERAGVEEGDFVIAIDDEPVKDAIHLLALARARRSGDSVAFQVERAARPLELTGIAPPLPTETSDVGEIELGTVEASGQRLRTIVNVPLSPGPHPSILYLQGLRPRSCEYPLDPSAPLRRLVDGWTKAGFLVLRVERSGVGDSEGPSCAVTGLDVELDAYVAGIDHLLSRSDVDPKRIVLFGQSLGAMTAPLLAVERDVTAGIMVYGASGARWHDCVIDTTQRQLRLTGMSEERLEAEVALWSELYGLVCRSGWTPALAFEKRPHLRVLQSMECVGETLSGRHASLYQELDRIDLFKVWGAVGSTGIPVLVGRGEYDWICTREEGEAIVRATGASARYTELERTGHDWLVYDSFEKSRQWGEGRWEGNVVGMAQTLTSSHPSAGKTQP